MGPEVSPQGSREAGKATVLLDEGPWGAGAGVGMQRASNQLSVPEGTRMGTPPWLLSGGVDPNEDPQGERCLSCAWGSRPTALSMTVLPSLLLVLVWASADSSSSSSRKPSVIVLSPSRPSCPAIPHPHLFSQAVAPRSCSYGFVDLVVSLLTRILAP